MSNVRERIKRKGRDLGFSMVGIAPANPSPHLRAYLKWIKSGMHGEMDWMARHDRVIRREDLNVILPNAETLIIAALDYYTLSLPDSIANDPARGRISNYAWGLDYHDVMLPRLQELAAFIENEAGTPVKSRAYVDTGAILERSHAKQAGLGFVGKNTMLIHPQKGSYFFLGEVITDLAMPFDLVDSEMPNCGTCTKCLKACPTDAFPKPYVLDARRCISYFTIESDGFIPTELRSRLGNWVYGCDVCQEVCPWQRFAEPTPWIETFAPDNLDFAAPPLENLLQLDERTFNIQYRGSPIERIGRDQLVRNACIAAGNSAEVNLGKYVIPLLHDDSVLVRGHAAWALGQLQVGLEPLRTALEKEDHQKVANEIKSALSAGKH